MVRRTAHAGLILTAMAAVMALVLALSVPALAHHKDGHDGGQKAGASDHDGDADSDSGTSYTEDDDTNDGAKNNEADEGDNAHPSGKDRSVEKGGSGNQGNSESDPDDDGRGPDRSNGGPDKPNGSGGTDLEDQDGNNGCGNDDDFEDDNEGWCGKKPKPETKPDATCPAGEMNDEGECVEGEVVCPDETSGEMTDEDCDEDEVLPKPPCPDEVAMHDVTGECHEEEVPETPEAPEDEGDDVEGSIDDVDNPGVDGDVDGAVESDVLGERITSDEAPGAAAPAVAERAATEGSALPFTGASILAFLALAGGLIASGVLFYRSR